VVKISDSTGAGYTQDLLFEQPYTSNLQLIATILLVIKIVFNRWFISSFTIRIRRNENVVTWGERRVDNWLYPSCRCCWLMSNDGGAEEKSGRRWTAAIVAWNCQHWSESFLCRLRSARANICQYDSRIFYMYILQWASVSSAWSL